TLASRSLPGHTRFSDGKKSGLMGCPDFFWMFLSTLGAEVPDGIGIGYGPLEVEVAEPFPLPNACSSSTGRICDFTAICDFFVRLDNLKLVVILIQSQCIWRLRMSDETIQVQVSRFEQNGQVMFVGVMNSSDIIRIADVDVRDEQTNPDGYQRYRDEARCRRIAEFINEPTSALPGSILLNLRGSATFVSDSEEDTHGILLIPNRKGTAWIVDGQHRMGGFEYTEREFMLPVVLFENLPRRQEMINFSIINDTQKGINTSLTLSLLGELRESIEDWKIQAHDIAYRLNRDPDSPWFERINMTGAKGMHRPVNLASFANALKPLLRQHGFFQTMDLNDQVLLLKRFWNATRDMFPDAWSEPRRHILLKTLGVYAMSQVAAYIFELCAAIGGDFSQKRMQEYLSPLAGFDWHRNTSPFRALGGLKGSKEAAATLIDRLPKISVTIAG
ncbi:MAG TPA: DGQHR domain-containing protein, partial [Anaerolineae bacterium]|nr:DGQHR domain-containing protein [Anaerolineae bacterium]